MFHYTALVTCLAIVFYFFTSIQVSKARVAFDIKVPATSGNLDFERVFRVQMNTLEWMPIFLPSLWLFAIYISDGIAAVLGLDRRPHPLYDRLFASRRKTHPRQTSRVVREVTVSDSCTAANSNSIRSPRRRAVEVAGARRDRVSWRS